MSKHIKIALSGGQDLSVLDSKIKQGYEQNNKVRFIFDVTNTNMNDVGNVAKIMSMVEKYKSHEHKLECIDIVCPKSHVLKRNFIKKCIKMAKVSKPVYLVENA